MEHSQNNNKTNREQYRRNQEGKNGKNNDKAHLASIKEQSHYLQESKTNNQKHLIPSIDNPEEKKKRITSHYINLRNNGFILSPKDECAIERICELPLKTERLESLLEGVFSDYLRKNPNGKISSALYCEKVLMTILEAEKNGKQFKKSKKESMSERVERLIEEGKIVLSEESQ